MSYENVGKYHSVTKACLMPFAKFAWRLNVEGLENVPRHGGALLAPNHLSALDSLFVPMALKRKITYVGKAEYLDEWKTRTLLPALGMIPIERSGGDAAKRALDAAASVLNNGELFGIYPEGTRSRDGLLHKGHTGVARLALQTSCPIIPVGVIGAIEVHSPESRLPRPFREVTVRFGEPIDVGRYADRASDRLVLRQITDEVMYAIRELSGQEYSHTYATKSAESVPSESAVITSAVADTAQIPESVDIEDLNLEPPAATASEEPTDSGDGTPGSTSSADVLRRNDGVQLVELG